MSSSKNGNENSRVSFGKPETEPIEEGKECFCDVCGSTDRDNYVMAVYPLLNPNGQQTGREFIQIECHLCRKGGEKRDNSRSKQRFNARLK